MGYKDFEYELEQLINFNEEIDEKLLSSKPLKRFEKDLLHYLLRFTINNIQEIRKI